MNSSSEANATKNTPCHESAAQSERSDLERQRRPGLFLAQASAVILAVSLVACASTSEEDSGSSAPPIDYVRQVNPLLEKNCYECHGDIQVPSGKLRLDTRTDALEGGRSGQPAIIPGNGASSPLVIAISGGDGERWRTMPPRGRGLRPEHVKLIRRWIDQGAPFDPE